MSPEMRFLNENLPIIEKWSRFLSIETDQDLDKTLVLVESLIDRKQDGESHLTPVIYSLARAIEKYETKYPIGEYAGIEMLKFLMDQNNHSQSDLCDIAAKSDIRNILSGKRKLNLNHIKKLCKKYNVSSDLFL